MKRINDFFKDHPWLVGVCAGGAVIGARLVMKFLGRRMPSNTVLELDLSVIRFVGVPKSSVGGMFGNQDGLIFIDRFAEILEIAQGDSRVRGLIARVGSSGIHVDSLSTLVKLRQALSKFTKPKYVWIEDLMDRGYLTYFVLSVFNVVSAFPGGEFLVAGLYSTHPFLKNAFVKFNVATHVSKRADFKTAANMFSEERYTDAERSQLRRLLGGVMEFTKAEIVQTRGPLGLDLAKLERVLEGGLSTAKEMVSLHVIDHAETMEQVHERMWTTLSLTSESQMNLLFLRAYVPKIKHRLGAKRNPSFASGTVAVLYAKGPVIPGRHQSGLGNPRKHIWADDLADQIDAVAGLKNVKAIVIRVVSPGGSAIASEVVRRAIVRARKDAGKKVVVSMGAVAASGGYWISMSADQIVCEEMSVTGSIGVFGIHFNFAGLFKNWAGVDFDSIKTNTHSRLHSTVHPWTGDDVATYEKFIDETYEEFMRLVSSERNLPLPSVRDLAQGKVYLGKEALALGLVDDTGSLDRAIEIAKGLAGFPDEEGKKSKLRVRVYPADSLARVIVKSLFPPKNSRDRKKQLLVANRDLGMGQWLLSRFGGERVKYAVSKLGDVADAVDAQSRCKGVQARLTIGADFLWDIK